MGTRFCGKITGFNPTGDNETTPNFMGPPTTKFGGRPATPAGPFKRFPGEVANIETGNRRLGKARDQDDKGMNDGVYYCGNTAFGGHRTGMRTGRKPGGMGEKPSRSMAYNKK